MHIFQVSYLKWVLTAPIKEEVLQAKDASLHLAEQPPDDEDVAKKTMDCCVTRAFVQRCTIGLLKL